MQKLFFGTIFLALLFVVPIPTMAMGRVDVGVSIPLPPPIIFPGPPRLVVIPETDVYADPDVNDDIFFYGGWWWRPWEGRWYRSQRYDSGWSHYRGTPSFHRSVPSGWRNDYRQRRWKGQQWEHQRVSHQQVQQNWNKWEKDQHWKKQNNWGDRDLM